MIATDNDEAGRAIEQELRNLAPETAQINRVVPRHHKDWNGMRLLWLSYDGIGNLNRSVVEVEGSLFNSPHSLLHLKETYYLRHFFLSS